jgi:hypothetical protein
MNCPRECDSDITIDKTPTDIIIHKTATEDTAIPIGVNKHVQPIVRQGFKPLPQSESPLKED